MRDFASANPASRFEQLGNPPKSHTALFRVVVYSSLQVLILSMFCSNCMAFMKGMRSCWRPTNFRTRTPSERWELGALTRPELIASLFPIASESTAVALGAAADSHLKRQIWEQLFDLELPEGRCVGLRLPALNPNHSDSLSLEALGSSSHWIHGRLHPQEVTYGIALPSATARQSFFLGRLAMREALQLNHPLLTLTSQAILKDKHGRPTVPSGYLGSISHKGNIGVALTAMDLPDVGNPKMSIGVDVEQTFSKRQSIAKKVLTAKEANELGRITGVTPDEEVLLRFSIKESLYKAMHPLLCEPAGFQEAEVTPHSNGTACVNWKLKSGSHERFSKVTVHWKKLECGEYFLTSASLTLKDE